MKFLCNLLGYCIENVNPYYIRVLSEISILVLRVQDFFLLSLLMLSFISIKGNYYISNCEVIIIIRIDNISFI